MDYEGLLDRLNLYLSEPIEDAASRASSEFDQFSRSCENRLILFGAGKIGRQVLSALRNDKITPLAFSDNNPQLWGELVDGLLVISPEEAAASFGRNACFIVTIYNSGHHSFFSIRSQLVALGCDLVIPVLSLRWKFFNTFLPYYHDVLPQSILSHHENIREAFTIWGDDLSRQEYVAQIAWRLRGEVELLTPPLIDSQYFPEGLFDLTPHEIFLDLGAYDGDTVLSFLGVRGNEFERVLAFEPDPENFARLRAYQATLPPHLQQRIEIYPLAASNHNGHLRFVAGDRLQSCIDPTGTIEIQSVRLDDFLVNQHPTYIKMDIEGAEPDALEGCQQIIRSSRPILAVCVYHAPDHLWSIPSRLHSSLIDYNLFLRPHMPDCWDTVCYAVPHNRLSKQVCLKLSPSFTKRV